MVVEKNIVELVNERAESYGILKHDDFVFECDKRFVSGNIESPIEQLLYIDLLYLSSVNPIKISIEPQKKISGFKVDFYIEYKPFNHTKNKWMPEKSIVVECDSKQWHDRSEKDRIYEKQRERKIIAKGFKLLRFTGTEIFHNHKKCAMEIINYLVDDKYFLVYEYD